MSVNLAITRRCNEYCPHCYVNAGGKNSEADNELGLEDWIAIIKECKGLGYQHIHIFGGEPFLVSFLGELCDAIDDYGLSYNIATNGLAIKSIDYNWIQNTGGSLVISLFGGETFHDQFTSIPQSYMRVYANIHTCLLRGLDVNIATCLMRRNLEDYPLLIQNFAAIGIQNFFALHFSPIGRGEQLLEEIIDPPTWYNFYLRLKQLLPRIRREVRHEVEVLFELATYPTENMPALLFTNEVMPCPLPKYLNLTIDWTGHVFPCILFLNDIRWSLGTLHEKPLRKILEEFKISWIQERVKKNHCPACKYYRICQGGCPAYTLGMLKDFRCSDLKFLPFCPLRVIPV